MDWQQKSYSVSSGIHTLKWVYVKDSSGESGDDCGWVDFVHWSGPSPEQNPSNFQMINYKHDLYGRRIEKKVDGFSTRYLYSGSSVIAEYDGNNNLLRKYIYGPGIDQPVCMIEVADSNAVYYYHFDALGSVVALSDASGDTVQTYEYSVYGQVAVEDINHTNPYMFAGRRFDIEIGLYYNRARYYDPFRGRFLQTDPIGYDDGMNMYRYCGNNPLNYRDPAGTFRGDANAWVPGGIDANDANDCNNTRTFDPCNPDWHLDRNMFNRAYKTVEEAAASPYFEREKNNPFHWPDTFRGKAGTPFEGYQASYYPDPCDPWLAQHPEAMPYYDASKAGQLDDETNYMGTYDYSPPSESLYWHGVLDVAPHKICDNYTPGLTTIIESDNNKE